MVISNNFKELISDINNGLKDKKYNINTEKTESDIYNIKSITDNDLKQSSFKLLKYKKKVDDNIFIYLFLFYYFFSTSLN